MKRKFIGLIAGTVVLGSLLPVTTAFADDPVTVLNGTTVRLEAENYAPSGNRVDDGVSTRYSGGKAAGSCPVNMSVYVPEAGTYTMMVAWGNQYNDNSGFSLTVNEDLIFSGKTGKTYGAQGQCFTVELNTGENSIAITQPSQGRVDFVEFTVLNSTDTVRLEAEDYAKSRTNLETASNGKFVGNEAFTASFNVVNAGKYIMKPGIGTAGANATSVTMQVNDDDPITQSVEPTWGGIRKTYEYEIELKAGINTFAVTQSSSRVDYIEFVPVAPLEPEVTSTVAATSNVEEDYITFRGEISNPDNEEIEKAGFGFVNIGTAEGSTSLRAYWTENTVNDNVFGAAIKKEDGAESSQFWAIPYIVVDGKAIFGGITASAWNQ